MPEGDSVYRLAVRLRRAADGARVLAGEVRSGDSAGASLADATVLGHDTHGKHLLTRFDTAMTLHTHMRMQGSWTVTRPGASLPRAVQDDVRVRMLLASGRTVWGIDLPVVEMVPTDREADVIGHLGPDPLRADWDGAQALRRLAERPDRTLVAALLDQRNLAGLGNLWVNELAYLRGVFPWRQVGDVDLEPLVALAVRALRLSATTPGMYQVTTGRTRRGEQHWVVGRAGRPCLRCSTVVRVAAEVPDDPERRRTWWCPHCQPE